MRVRKTHDTFFSNLERRPPPLGRRSRGPSAMTLSALGLRERRGLPLGAAALVKVRGL
jgi:hypothetical protein